MNTSISRRGPAHSGWLGHAVRIRIRRSESGTFVGKGKQMKSRRLVIAMVPAVTVFGWLASADQARSEAYPVRPIRLIVPYASGGPTDVLGRIIGQHLGKELRQPVVVDNRPGSGGTVGTAAAAKAPPDGYTLLMGDIALSLSPFLYKEPGFDPVAGFAPIGLAGAAQLVLWINPELSARNLRELIALAKQKPGKLSYASAGAGNLTHLVPELFKARQDLDILHVPYRSSGPALADVAAGHVDMMFTGLSAAKPFLEGRRLRALAITGAGRSAALPEVPTFAEAGVALPELDVGSWWGLLAPVGTSREVVASINRALERVLESDEVNAHLAALNITPMHSTPQRFGEWIRSEMEKWGPVIRRAGIEPS